MPVARGVEGVSVPGDELLAWGPQPGADLHRLHPVERIVAEATAHAVRVVVGAKSAAVVVPVRSCATADDTVGHRCQAVERIVPVADVVGTGVALGCLAVACQGPQFNAEID